MVTIKPPRARAPRAIVVDVVKTRRAVIAEARVLGSARPSSLFYHRSGLVGGTALGHEEGSMARMEPLGIDEVDNEIRHLCEEAERQSGSSASTRTYARNPVVVKALAAFRATLAREGSIDPVLRELVRLKIAALNRCHY